MAFLDESGTRKYFFLDRYIGSETGVGGLKEWVYITVDDFDTVTTAGYFAIDYKHAVVPGDTIRVYVATDRNDLTTVSAAYFLRVTARSASAITVAIHFDAALVSYDKVNLVRDRGADPSGATVIDTAMTNGLSDLSTNSKGVIDLIEGSYLTSGGISITQHNVTIEGRGRGTVLKKQTADEHMIRVGDSSLVTENNYVRGFRLRHLRLDGNGTTDTSNNYAMIYCQYVDDAVVEDISGVDGGVFVRFGRGDSGWTNRRAKNCRLLNSIFENPQYGNEFFGVDGGLALGNKIIGGAASDTDECRPIRIVASKDVEAIANKVRGGTGNGLFVGTDAASGPNERISLIANIVSGCTQLSALRTDFDTYFLTVVGNQFLGGGANFSGPLVWLEFDTSHYGRDLEWADNQVIGDGTESDLLRIDYLLRGKISGGKFKHTGGGLASSHYGIRLVAGDGLIEVDTPTIEMDDNNARGIWDVSGLAGLTLVVNSPTFLMDLASSGVNNAVAQSASSGTLRLYNPRVPNVAESQVRSTDAAFSLTAFVSPRTTYVTATLTADRAVTLTTTNAYDGLRYKIVRTGSGAFNLNVGTGPLAALAQDEWCEVAYHGGAFKLEAFGSLV